MSILARESARVGRNLGITFAFLIPMVFWPAGGRIVGAFGTTPWFRYQKEELKHIHV